MVRVSMFFRGAVFLDRFCELNCFNRVAVEIVVHTAGVLAFNWCSHRFIFASGKGFDSVESTFRFVSEWV